MIRQYHTFKQQTDTYIDRHQPTNTRAGCCVSLTPALVARFLLRTAIPILFGLSSGMLSEWAERKAGMHNNDALLEVSDFVSCGVTLLITYTINALLNCCWPVNPYQSDFFQAAMPSDNTSAALLEGKSYHAQSYT